MTAPETHLTKADLDLTLKSLLIHGRISQVPNRLTLMASGRSYTYTTPLGVIEFVHTARSPNVWRARCVVRARVAGSGRGGPPGALIRTAA